MLIKPRGGIWRVSPTEKATSLGAECKHSINWSWAKFPTREPADEFVAWLDANDYDHRGVYSLETGEFAIRYR